MSEISNNSLCRLNVGSVNLAYKDQGEGEPIIFIHGSWDDHHSWDGVAAILQNSNRVIRYDRRGHSASSGGYGQGSINEDVNDVIGFMEGLGINEAHIVGHSYGANIAIMLCEKAPAMIKSIFIHEPPIFSLLSSGVAAKEMKKKYFLLMQQAASLIEAGKIEDAAIIFIEKVAFGKGAWKCLFDKCARQAILSNVDTWLDQFKDPDRLAVDVNALNNISGKVVISTGTASLEPYGVVVREISRIIEKIAVVEVKGAGHGAHISHPDKISKAILHNTNQ